MKIFVTILFALAVMGCASSGARYDQSAIAKIHPGVTMETQLHEWFGKPFRVDSLDNGRKKMIWQYTRGAAMVGVTEQHELFVTMSADGKVESFEERNK